MERPGRWRDVALVIALAGVLAAIAALGIGVLSTWDVAGPSSSKTIEGDPLKAVHGRAVEPPAGE